MKEKENEKKKEKKRGLGVWKLELTLMRGRAVAWISGACFVGSDLALQACFELIIVITKTSHPIFVRLAGLAASWHALRSTLAGSAGAR